MTCQHEDFIANVDVNRLQREESDLAIYGYSADITVRCSQCGEPFIFVGVPVGLMPNRPTMNPNGTELRVPLRPQSSDPHFGLGMPGFIARVAEADQATDN